MNNYDQIKRLFADCNLEYILYGLWRFQEDFQPFQISATVTLAMEHSPAGPYLGVLTHPPKSFLSKLVNVATQKALEVEEKDKTLDTNTHNIFYYLFKSMANQLEMTDKKFGAFGRALLLYKIIPEKLIAEGEDLLNLPECYKQQNRYTIEEFLSVCFVAFAAVGRDGTLVDRYYETGREKLILPSKNTINKILSDISATPKLYKEAVKILTEKGNNSFSFLPLLQYPLLKPWGAIKKKGYGKRYIAPLPHLIPHKAHSSIYHFFLTKYGLSFTRQFGKPIFETYVGEVLTHSLTTEKLHDEKSIKSWFDQKKRIKTPDWIVENNNRAIIFECKAARLPLAAQTSGLQEDFKTTFEKINRGVTQIREFIEACHKDDAIKANEIKGVIVTYEKLYGFGGSDSLSKAIASDFLTEKETAYFNKGMENIIILSVQELEALQPHFSNSINLWDVINRLFKESYNDVIKDLEAKTGKNYGDCFLSQYDNQLLENMGIESRI